MDSKFDSQFLVIKGKRATWYRPTKFEDLLHLKSKYPEARIVGGNTEIGMLQREPVVLPDNLAVLQFLFFSFIIQCLPFMVMIQQFMSSKMPKCKYLHVR